jgi:hypothetical protein
MFCTDALWSRSQPRKTYTGKVGGMQDDVSIALQLAIAAQKTFFESSKYANFAKQTITHESGVGNPY